jgi:Carboxypeptidase activation peptide
MEIRKVFLVIFVLISGTVHTLEATMDTCRIQEKCSADPQIVDNKARYDNYRLYRLHMVSDEHVLALQQLEEQSDSYTFYGHAMKPGQDLTIMVAAHKIAEIHDLMERFGIEGKLLVRAKSKLHSKNMFG